MSRNVTRGKKVNPYNWFKLYHGTTTDPKWRLLARKIGLPEGVIVSVWVAVLEYASQQEERGSVQNFSCEDYDCCFGYEDGTCEKVFVALSQRGLIANNFVVNWDKRQSMQDIKKLPKTDAQRQAECRERKRQAEQEQQEPVTKCHDECDTVTPCHEECDTVTKCHDVTPIREEERREEEIRTEEKREEEITEEEKEDLSSNLTVGQSRPSKNAALRPDDFEQWYLAYPRHEGRQNAVKAWNRAIKEKALPDIHTLLAALVWQRGLSQWQEKQFIPLPASYLNGRRWQDERPAQPMSDGQRIFETYKRWEDEFNQRQAAEKQAALGANNG